MSDNIKTTERLGYINLEKTMENVANCKYTDEFSYVDVNGTPLEWIIRDEHNPDYTYKGEDEEFLKYLKKYVDEVGVYIALGDGSDIYLRNAFRTVEFIIPDTVEEAVEYLEENQDKEDVVVLNITHDHEYDKLSCDDFMTGFGAEIKGNPQDGYTVTYGVQSHCGPCWNPPMFSSHEDNGDKNSSWDISSPLCRKVIELSREMISKER